MKVRGLDNKSHTLQLDIKNRGESSQLHVRARKILQELMPFDKAFEEVALEGSKTSKNGLLYVDFLLPSQSLAIEVQGEQHSKYVPFFHKTKAGFTRSKVRDDIKREWCELNDITLVELPYNETDDEWKCRIKNR